MSLSISLNTALTGLNVNQQQLSILSQNIANANTQGYSKQTGSQQSVFVNGRGNGVSVAEVTRKVDEYLVNAVQEQSSNVSLNAALDDYSSRLQLIIGNPGSQNSIDSYINTYFNSVQSLVQTPQNTTLQQTVVNNGKAAAEQISSLATSVRELQFQADQDIKAGVEEINKQLRRVAELNTLVTNNISLGKSTADLEDQRDNAVSKIGDLIDVSTFRQPNGALNIITGGGITILDSTVYQLNYSPLSSAVSFSDGSAVAPITVFRVDANNNRISPEIILADSAPIGEVTSVFTKGRVAGLLEMRDEQLPNILAQLDTISSSLRDNLNAIHNSGSGYPGANVLNGTREVFADQINQWGGQTRIAVLDSNGQPVPSVYADETNGTKPLLLDLQNLDTLNGRGNPSVQGIIDAINSYYGTPQNKLKLGDINNIQLVSNSISLPASPPRFNFDFNLSNLTANPANFFVTNVSVADNNGNDITATSSTIPRVNLSAGNTYVTSASDASLTVNTDGAHGLSEGQIVYMSTPPGGPYDGIPASELGGYFRITSVNNSSFKISVSSPAVAGQTFGVAGQTVLPPYKEAGAGLDTRTQGAGNITADLSGNDASPFYTIAVTVGVANSDGSVDTSVINYRVDNQQPYVLNKVFGATSKQGSGELINPAITAPLLTARLVDINGKELTKIGGRYTNTVPGYLQLRAGTSNYQIAIDSLDSTEGGNPTISPVTPGSNRSFSHYFELNNFFQSNVPTNTGDTIKNSALNLKVEDRFSENPGLLSLGQMIKKADPSNPLLNPNYTYQVNPGDNSVVSKLSTLSSANINFIAAGGLGATLNTFSGYSAQILGSIATNAQAARENRSNSEGLLEGFQESASAISGVNLDVELANTVIYQNAYAASARVITVTNELFDTLISSF